MNTDWPNTEKAQTSLILCDYSELRVCCAPELESLTTAALATTSHLEVVDSAASQAEAVVGLKEIVRLLRRIENDHKLAKEPVLDLCRKIDRRAVDASDGLNSEQLRINRLISDYQEAERENARAAERLRLAELARLEAENQAAQRKIQEDLERRAAAERNLAKRAALESQAADAVRRQQELAIQAVEAVGPPVVAPKAEGQSVRPDWAWEVTDIHKLYRANPGLVELVPRKREIRECIAILATGETPPNIPGLRVWREIKISVRTAERKTIDV